MEIDQQQALRFERVATRALGIGVLTSAGLLAIGLTCRLLAFEPWASRVLDAGLVVLMATPAARLAVSLIEYLRARDWFFVATTLGVALVLIAALVSALVGR